MNTLCEVHRRGWQLLLCFLMLAASSASAATITHQASGLEFELPNSWQVIEDTSDLLVVANPTNTVAMSFSITTHSDAGTFLRAMGDELRRTVDITSVTDERDGMIINDLSQSFAEGEGRAAQGMVEWGVTLVTGGFRPMVVFTYGDISGNQDAVYTIYDSIRKARATQMAAPKQQRPMMHQQNMAQAQNRMQMQTIQHETGVMIDFPANWQSASEDDVLGMAPPAGDVLMILAVSRYTDIDSYLNALDQEIGQWIKRPQVTWGPYGDVVNGLSHAHVEGIGMYEGKLVDWDLRLVLGDNRSMVILTIGDITRMQDTVTSIYQSVRAQ